MYCTQISTTDVNMILLWNVGLLVRSTPYPVLHISLLVELYMMYIHSTRYIQSTYVHTPNRPSYRALHEYYVKTKKKKSLRGKRVHKTSHEKLYPRHNLDQNKLILIYHRIYFQCVWKTHPMSCEFIADLMNHVSCVIPLALGWRASKKKKHAREL